MRNRWLNTLGFPGMVLAGLTVWALLWPLSRPLAVLWLVAATVSAWGILSSAVRGWALWWRRRG